MSIETQPLPSPPRPDDTAERQLSRWAVFWAWFGVVGGILLYVVPGIFAIRSLTRWQKGKILRPTFAWVMAGIWGVVLVLGLVGGIMWYANFRNTLLFDNFSSDSSGWPEVNDERASATYADGRYIVTASDGTAYYGLRWSEGDVSDVSVEIRLVRLQGTSGAAGVGCGNGFTDQGYLFEVSADGTYQILAVQGGRVGETLMAGSAPVAMDADGVTLRAECRNGTDGHELRMFADDLDIATVSVSPTFEGFDAIIASVTAGAGNVEARFDDASAETIDA